MKVCIVTLYNSINSGSFWQAYALGIAIKKMGHEVVYLKIKRYKKAEIKRIIKRTLKFGVNGFKKQYKMHKDFKESQKKAFNIIKNNTKDFEDVDLFILGSDTIWNLESKNLENQRNVFFGGRFKNKKVISYAASIANTSEEKLKEHNDIQIMLKNIEDISVRDDYTYNVVKNIVSRDITLVCDPTLLLDKSDYSSYAKRKENDKYMFLYLFSKLSREQEEKMKLFAKQHNLKIISGYDEINYNDKCIANSPDEFLNYMYYADYIITDTFHGTVFSVNLRKQFVSINRNKKKVNDFLDKCDLNDRLIDESNINKLEEVIDYKKTEECLSVFKKASIDYLKKYL